MRYDEISESSPLEQEVKLGENNRSSKVINNPSPAVNFHSFRSRIHPLGRYLPGHTLCGGGFASISHGRDPVSNRWVHSLPLGAAKRCASS